MKLHLKSCTGLGLGLLLPATPVTAASLTPLGDLPGGSFSSQATAVSRDGVYVVGYSRSSDGFEAFRWSRAEGMVGLGDLPGGEFTSEAAGISADGGIVVGTGISTNTATGFEAFLWTPADGMKPLTRPRLGVQTSRANGISADGRVVVGYAVGGPDPEANHAFRWTAAAGLEFIGDLPGGGVDSAAHAVSADGGVIVGTGAPGEGAEGFRWTRAGGFTGLGQLPGDHFPVSASQAVSADGNIIVGLAFSTNAPTEAFRWTASDGMVALGDIPIGEFASRALGVSNDGRLIVGEVQGEFSQEAGLWRPGAAPQRLWDYLLALGLDPAADGWTDLFSAAAVTGDGRFVVGWGRRNGNSEAYLADLSPRLEFTRSADRLRLAWPAGFKLQRAATPATPAWADVPGAVSPREVPLDDGPGFFRVVSTP
jgi:probable HAF family extracellular repeat protein